MLKKSYINIGLVGLGNVFNALLGFAFLATVAKHLSVEEFGKYALLTTMLVSLSKLLDFGTNSLFVAKTSADKEAVPNNFLGTKLVLFFIAVPISLIVLSILKLITIHSAVIFILGLAFYGISYTLFAYYQKAENYLALIVLNGLPAIIKGFFAGLLIFNIISLELLQMFAIFAFSIAASSLMIFFLPKELKTTKPLFKNSKLLLKEALSPGIAQLITESISAISNAIAKVTINFTGVGIFAIADKISNIFVLASFSIFTVLLPKNARRKQAHQKYDFKEAAVLILGISVMTFAAIFAAKVAIPWFFEHKYDASLPIFNILVFASAFSAIHAFMENYFYVEGKTHYLAYIYLGKLSLLILTASILIPLFNVTGLAWAQLAASVGTLGLMGIVIKKSS